MGGDVYSDVCDAADSRSVEGFVAGFVDRFGGIDGLVNNAGTSGTTPLEGERNDALWGTVLRVNLDGPYFFTASSLPHMSNGGRIVNISSILGRFGVPGYAAYCTSKHGLIGLTRTAALELAPRGITVNAICPGWVDTEMARKGMHAGAEATDQTYEEFRADALAAVPLGVIVEPDEVASLIAFLLGPDAGNITGQAYNICGGQTMG